MRNLILCLFIAFSYSTQAQKGKVKFTIHFTGIEEGYDHTTRDQIFIDDVLVKTTEEHLESEAHTFTLKMEIGQHAIRVVNWTKYQGKWEETTVENQYNFNGFFSKEFSINKKNTLDILYDIDDTEHSPIVKFN